MSRMSARSMVAAAAMTAMIALLAGGAVGDAGAQGVGVPPDPPPSETSTTTTTSPPPDDSTTTAPVPGGDPGATSPSTTPTDPAATTDSTGADAPNYQNDDDLVGKGFYSRQGAFDPASKQGLPQNVARARVEQRAAAARSARAESDLAQARQAVDSLQAELAQLEAGQRQAIEDAAAAKSAFVETAVSAYMHGRESESFALLDSANPTEYARRTELLSAVLDRDSRVAADYQQKRDALTEELQQRVDAVDGTNRAYYTAAVDALTATTVGQAADWQLRTFENNSRVWVPGFTFPVNGPVQFVDSFGYPRLVGTGQQHWHEGTDVMAAPGTPMVAVEDGVVTKVGESSLGGLSLKITGASGYWFYYAHLSGFAPDLVEGMPIAAGTLVGFVGDTGDAKGGATHLHFEVHQPDGKPLDPFGLLKTAWQARQQQLALGGADPITGSSMFGTRDPGTSGGFPRFLDGRPVFADPARQPAFDPLAPPPTAPSTMPSTMFSTAARSSPGR